MATFIMARGNSTEVFPPVDGTFNDITAFVSRLIETWQKSTSPPFAQTVFLRIAALGENTTHATILDAVIRRRTAAGDVYATAAEGPDYFNGQNQISRDDQ